MMNICKVTSTIELEFTRNNFGTTTIVSGKFIIHQGKGKKIQYISFMWNMSVDINPRLIGRKYDQAEVEQLKSIIDFYMNITKEDK